MIKRISILVCFFFIYSCSNIELVINEDLNKEYYKNQTAISFNGENKEIFNQELYSYFGEAQNQKYILNILFKEERKNRLVKKNQVAEKTDFEIIVDYKLYYTEMGCDVFRKKIITKFSFVPKSFGYNFGTDKSLEKLYKNSIRKNIANFIKSSPKEVNFDCLK